jgi:2Fe-2S ferredoxin
MIEVQVTDRSGDAQRVEWAPDQSLMESLRDADLPVLASCGGTASCSTCHVYVASPAFPRFGDRTEDEQELLEDSDYFRDGSSRLSCQMRYVEDLRDVSIELAPED